ncbi:MAG: TldD/PmbA family protein, partial [Anaerolineaceae bacterium]
MRDRLQEAIKIHDVEYVDIRIEDKLNTWVNFRGPDLDTIGSARTMGGIVRALYKGGWGYATFNDLEDLPKRVREACATARLVGVGTTYFAPTEPVVDTIKAELIKDFRQIALADKKSLAEEYNRIILGYHKNIQTSSVRYADSFKTIWYANSEGTYIEEEVPDVNLSVSAIARDGDIVQTAFENGGGIDGYQSVEGFHEHARAAAQKAIDLLAAPPVNGGKYPVITDQILTGVFTHEAFGHLSESDFVYENPKMQDLMQLGKRFGVD